MEYTPVWSYDNYIPAHIAAGRLEEEGIDCWLKDENSVTILPMWTNAVGGIKLMVPNDDAKRAWEILNTLAMDHKASTPCPRCGSVDNEVILSQRKASNVFGAIFTFCFLNYALAGVRVYHCFKCGHEYPFD